ncbi:MAG TPA: flippase-like domain-containing protein [Candidatus Caccovivens faecavium]|nr:flippase-like domain-containing protein [Candidatus Caccovivens faecavium]
MDDKKVVEEVVENNKVEEPVVNKKGKFFSRLKEKREKKKEEKIEELKKEDAEKKEVVEEKLEEVNKEVKKINTKKQKIINICFLIFNIALVVAILLWNLLGSDEGFTPLSQLKISGWFVLIYLLCIAMLYFLDVLSINRMIYRKTYRSRWCLSYKSGAICRYYDAVTPMASGGQAFMASYLISHDVPASTALSIPLSKLVFQNFAWIIICAICLICASFNPQLSGFTFVSVASIIGFILALGMITVILFMSLSKNGKKVVGWFIKILHKMHLIKNYEKKYQSTMKVVDDYQAIMREYSKSIWDIIYQIVLHGARNVVTNSMPFFIYCIFKGFPATGAAELYSTFFMAAALIELSSSFIPLPGGSGMNELTFTIIFSNIGGLGGDTFWALLLWRFATYYFQLIQGLSIITYDTVYGNRKWKWTKKRSALQEESQIFKAKQIELFRAERNKRRKREKSAKLLNN